MIAGKKNYQALRSEDETKSSLMYFLPLTE